MSCQGMNLRLNIYLGSVAVASVGMKCYVVKEGKGGLALVYIN